EDLVARAWRKNTASTPALTMTKLMEEDILPNISGKLLLGIEYMEIFWEQAVDEGCKLFVDDFFNMLKSWVSKREEPWPRLRLMLEVSTTPARITRKPNCFNVPYLIRLEDFSQAQVQKLCALYKLDWEEADIKELMSVVGGHPYLVQKAMYRAVT